MRRVSGVECRVSGVGCRVSSVEGRSSWVVGAGCRPSPLAPRPSTLAPRHSPLDTRPSTLSRRTAYAPRSTNRKAGLITRPFRHILQMRTLNRHPMRRRRFAPASHTRSGYCAFTSSTTPQYQKPCPPPVTSTGDKPEPVPKARRTEPFVATFVATFVELAGFRRS